MLAYRLPREPSGPRGNRLAQAAPYGCGAGAGRVGGVARRRGRLNSSRLADEVLEAGGEASVWLGRLGSASQERALAARMAEAVADYEAVIAEAEASEGEAEVVRRRAVAGCGGSCSGSAGGTSSRPATRCGPALRSTGWLHRWWCREVATRAGCMWIGRRALAGAAVRGPEAEFVFVDDADEVEADATPFDMRGVELSHHGGDCTFETMLRRFGLDDPVLWDVARIVHEADLADDRFDAPEAVGLDVICRGLSMILDDPEVLR